MTRDEQIQKEKRERSDERWDLLRRIQELEARVRQMEDELYGHKSTVRCTWGND